MSASFGELLRRHRLAAGLTQAGLAERADLSEQGVSMLERGSRRRPRTATIEALAGALGLDSDAAQQLSLAVRDADGLPQGARAAVPRTSLAPAGTVPRQLPPTLPDFTGRADELESTIQALVEPARHRGTVGLVAVTGMGGVGKTALAVQAAHRTGDAFPDGHLYLNLRGYGPGAPMTVIEALAQLLRSLGLDTQSVPPGVEEAAALLRSQLAGRRVLILLDNATNVRHVMPLLPGSTGSAAIVTSRRSLTTLPGCKQVRLDALSEDESIGLLSNVVGQDRIAAEPAAAKDLVRFASRLPLAVRLVSARLAARPNWPLQHLVDQLKNEHRRLDELGSDESGVRASISGSVRFLESSDAELDRQAAHALKLLGIPDGSDMITATAARLFDSSELQADAVLERLVDLNLLESIGPGRYRFHDLIRTYARELSQQAMTVEQRDAALERVLRFYAVIAWECQAMTHSTSPRLMLATVRAESALPFTDMLSALNWLDDEQANIVDRFRQAFASPTSRSALLPELALAMFGYNESRARWAEMRQFSRGTAELARTQGLALMAAWLEHDRAIPEVENGDLESARSYLMSALEMFRAISDQGGQARCYSSLSHVLERLGHVDEALEMSSRALSLSQQVGDKTVEGVSYVALAALHNRNGDHVLADQAFERSIALAEATGDLRSMAKRHLNAGLSHFATGRVEDAVSALFRSLEVSEQLGDQNAQSETLLTLAMIYAATGDRETAALHARQALKLARAYKNKLREGRILLELGRISAAAGDEKDAVRHWEEAAAVLRHVSTKYQDVVHRLLAPFQGNDHQPAAQTPAD